MRGTSAIEQQWRSRGQIRSSREQFYEEQQNKTLRLLAGFFILVELILRIDSSYFDIRNPLGLPGALSQMLFYAFGLTFAVGVAKKKEIDFPWPPVAAIFWIAGLTLASVFAVRPGEAFPQAVSFAIYMVSGYGIYKVSLNDKLLFFGLKVIAVIGVGWSFFLMGVFIKHGMDLPYEYTAYLGYKGSFNHHAYGLLIINGAVAMLALLSKKKGWGLNLLITIIISWTFLVIIISQARACFLVFATTATYILLKNENIRGKGQSMIKWAWLVVTLIVIMWGIKGTSRMDEEMVKRFDFQDREYQLKKSHGRPQMLKKAFILISKNPIGVGGYNARYTNVGIAELAGIEGFLLHNQYLTAIAEGGWIVIITWLILIRNTMLRPLKYRWKTPARMGIYACWVNQIMMGFFADMIGNFFFLMLFVVSAAISLENRDRKEELR